MLAEASLFVLLLGNGKTNRQSIKDVVKLTPVQMTGGMTGGPVEPCVWPKVCKKDRKHGAFAGPVLAGGPVTTCQWPNTCNQQN